MGTKLSQEMKWCLGHAHAKKNAVPSWSMVLYLIFLFIAKTVQLLILIWKRNFIHVNKKKNKKKFILLSELYVLMRKDSPYVCNDLLYCIF